MSEYNLAPRVLSIKQVYARNRLLSGGVSLRAICRIVTPGVLIFLWAILCSGAALAFDMPTDEVHSISEPRDLWRFLPIGYLTSILIETPVLLVGLSKEITFRQRLFAGVWLTACSYPIVVLVMPVLLASSPRWMFLLVAETFAPVSECALFWLVFQRHMDLSRATKLRNFAVIVLANLCSFGAGELLRTVGWFGLF